MAALRWSRRPPAVARTAFVLSGGGNLGAIQVGMLRALTERGIRPDLVLGCSVGAINGAAFAADPTLGGLRRLESMWLGIDATHLMPSNWVPAGVQLARRGGSLHGNGGLRSMVEQSLRGVERFEYLEVPFQCVATDIAATAERWFSEGPLVEPILASAALPAVYPIVEIDGREYLDGAIVCDIPIARAVELGATRLVVMHTGQFARPRTEVRRPLDVAITAYWIARNARFARDLAALPTDVELHVLPPGERTGLRYDDFSRTQELMTRGYLQAGQYLDDHGVGPEAPPPAADRSRPLPWRRATRGRTAAGEQREDAAGTPAPRAPTGGPR